MRPASTPAATSYFHRPEELLSEISDAGFLSREFVAISGSVKLFHDLSQWLCDDGSRGQMLSLLRLLEAEPSLIGLSQNFVAIAQAPAEG